MELPDERLEDLTLSKRKAFTKKFSWSHGCKLGTILVVVITDEAFHLHVHHNLGNLQL